MAFDAAKAAFGEAIVRQIMRYLSGNPEENLVNLVKFGESVAREEQHKQYCRQWARMFADRENNWRELVVRLLRETSPRVRDRLAVNFFVNAGLLCPARLRESEKKYGVHVPWAILIDPTGRCNLRCRGCWAAEYDRTKDMDFATLDRVLTEAEKLGIRFFVVSGGEPTVRMDDLIRLAEKHDESVFHVFTNGTLITEEAARRFADLGNVTFAISLEGFEASTDARRGPGVFRKVMKAMDNLKEAGVVFGFSATYTRFDTEEIGSDEFIDLMVSKGCALGWLFTYVPVGGDADLDYMATPEQRAYMFRKVQEWRSKKPILVADFWNDGEAVGGCIAGGRSYFHINAAGDVEPCAFVHYSNVNIKNCSLVEALKSPLFQAYQKNQPFNANHLRPCPIIDNPQFLEKMVAEAGAHPTQANGVTASQLCGNLYSYAEAWGKVSDEMWAETHRTVGKAAESASNDGSCARH
jgi:MoaA/NifB/PqqE/SkfB family radical SAM enzyme